ncbi:hypothetical protein ADENT20671_1794 [Actinomyces denticolens]|nr:hypothetical protein ADENT20671_1794 [Actinomyces denticolens]
MRQARQRALRHSARRAGGARGSELGDDGAHGLLDGRQATGAGRGLPQGVGGEFGDVGGRADRVVDDGPDPRFDAHPDPGQGEGDHDVGEEDRGVDAVAPHGLEGRLGGRGGIEAGPEHPRHARAPRPAPAQRAVLGQRAPGLAHEPHGGAAGARAAQCREKRGEGVGAIAHSGIKTGKCCGNGGLRWDVTRCANGGSPG